MIWTGDNVGAGVFLGMVVGGMIVVSVVESYLKSKITLPENENENERSVRESS